MGLESESDQLLSKIATNNGHGENSAYFDGWKAYDDPFHPTQNPNGVIQMGLAENQLSFDLIEDWIKKNPKASICTSVGANAFKDIANFQDYHGLPEFRNAVAKFMGRVRGGRVTFGPNRILMSGGATGANELLMFCLADPRDGFLIPTPYYTAFDRDLRWQTGVQLLPVICKSSNNFKITMEALEEAYDKAIEAKIKVLKIILDTVEKQQLYNLSSHSRQAIDLTTKLRGGGPATFLIVKCFPDSYIELYNIRTAERFFIEEEGEIELVGFSLIASNH